MVASWRHAYSGTRLCTCNFSDALDGTSKDKKYENKYASQYGRLISEFREHPEKFKLEESPKIPDGSPIGSFSCDY